MNGNKKPAKKTKKKEDLVITPGGPRPKDRVHPVGPGQAVRRNANGTYAVVPKEEQQNINGERRPSMPEEFVLTPGGYKPKSLVHLVEAGHVLRQSERGLQKVHPSGKVVREFAPIAERPSGTPLMPANVFLGPSKPAVAAERVPALGSGWIVYAFWNNNTGTPISSFQTYWVVPPAPATQSGQTIFLFNGIQNSTMIYQPVLQWGPSAAGGGNYWAVASWYADGQGGNSFYSQLTQVNPGALLIGIMTLTGQQGNLFNYNCQFQGITNSNLPIQMVQELTWAAETLEAYNLAKCSDYPATGFSALRKINIQTGNVNPALNWTPANDITDCGQKCVVVSNSATDGEVDLYYGTTIAVVLAGCAALGANADGRLEAFVLGQDYGLWHNWQVQPNGGWSGWNPLAGVLTSDPAVSTNVDGRLEVFARGKDDALWHNWQVAPNSGWSGWNSLSGSITSDPAVGQNGDGRLETFVRGTDNALWHIWQVAPNGGWSSWDSLGGVITSDPVVGSNADGRLEAFARGTDNALWHIWQVAPNGGWSSWDSLGGTITSVSAVRRNADGRLEVFARGTDNAVWHNWQVAPNGGWSGWNSLGGIITSDPIVSRNADGRLEVFARGMDDAVWHIWQVAPNGGWSVWDSLGGVITSDPVVGQNADGRLEVFARGLDNALWHNWQVVPNGGWSGWDSLGGGLAANLAVSA